VKIVADDRFFDGEPSTLRVDPTPEASALIGAAVSRLRNQYVEEGVEWVSPVLEDDEHHLRKRRSYAEIAGSEGYRIIMEAGLKAFPPLTPRQVVWLKQQHQATASLAADASDVREEASRPQVWNQ